MHTMNGNKSPKMPAILHAVCASGNNPRHVVAAFSGLVTMGLGFTS